MTILWISGLFHFWNFSSTHPSLGTHSSIFSIFPPVLAAPLSLHSKSLFLLASFSKQPSHPGLSFQLPLYLLTPFCLCFYCTSNPRSTINFAPFIPRQSKTGGKIPCNFADGWHCWELQDFGNRSIELYSFQETWFNPWPLARSD